MSLVSIVSQNYYTFEFLQAILEIGKTSKLDDSYWIFCLAIYSAAYRAAWANANDMLNISSGISLVSLCAG